eukprot:TRINITY_DN9993_c0_g1_i2.p1 TRINITY_DN9993_c0_g1~~TRINITY_DN9993_c0_g1_i2.p1  ORF type:complete len:218 (-),score=22.15 TRINITY_DN9993_c0_g1_i2:18-602(-)
MSHYQDHPMYDVYYQCFHSLKNSGGNFESAFKKIPHYIQSYWMASYQSWLWNLIETSVLREICGHGLVSVPITSGNIWFYSGLNLEQRSKLSKLSIAMPCRSSRYDDAIKPLVVKTLAQVGVSLSDLHIPSKTLFFSDNERRAIIYPEDMKICDISADDLHSNRMKLTFSFSLPSGSFATVLIKRLILGINHRL